jgi:RNA polymerase sigma-70 factor, ECF subfamily
MSSVVCTTLSELRGFSRSAATIGMRSAHPWAGGLSGCALKKPNQNACVAAPALTDTASRAAAAAAPSFAEVFETQAAYVLGLLARLGVAAADVDDVAQEVFIVIHQKLPEFEGRSSLKTWVCGICLRKASDYRRRAHRRRERLVAESTDRADAALQPEATALRHEHVRQLQEALAALPEAQMQVFVLYELEELPMADVARAVGCPRFTAYTRLRAARRAIREQLERAQAAGRSG